MARSTEIESIFSGFLSYQCHLFWIAQEVAYTKDRQDASSLFRLGKDIAGKKPLTIITEVESHSQAYKKEFRTIQVPRSVHVREIRLAGKVHNN